MKQKEIYIANLDPAKGKEQQGNRPVVIISGNILNNNLGICIICPITSKIKNYPACVIIEKNKMNNLSVKSEIITFQIRTITKDRLISKIGEITDQELQEIFNGLKKILTY